MNIADFRTQLEEEMSWRSEEILFFQNQCALITKPDDQNKFRRALILLLYANFEGLCKFAFTLYVSAINAASISCRDATYAIAAASLSDVFQYLRDGTGKAKDFKKQGLPDDKVLHKFARDREFLEQAMQIMERKVTIREDVVDAESNLNPEVLRKILFRLGLPHDQFSDIEKSIQDLLRIRNNIAHGATKEGIDEKLYTTLRDSAFTIMNTIIRSMTEALAEKRFMISLANNNISGECK